MIMVALQVEEASDLLHYCLTHEGCVKWGTHFLKELTNEGLIFPDAWHVLRKGLILKPPEHDVRTGEWKESVEGNEPDAGDIRFLRKYAGKSAAEFARLLHVDNTHLSKVENGRLEVGDQTDKYIRVLVMSMSPELKNKFNELLEMLPEIEDSCIEPKP